MKISRYILLAAGLVWAGCGSKDGDDGKAKGSEESPADEQQPPAVVEQPDPSGPDPVVPDEEEPQDDPADVEEEEEEEEDFVPPVPGSVSVTDLTSHSLKISWQAASDDVTPSEFLEYKLMLDDAVLMDWKADRLFYSVTDLTMSTSYTLTVIVRDYFGNEASYPAQTIETEKGLRVFTTAAAKAGSFGSIAQADSFCEEDNNHPGGSAVFKAMIADGSERRACTSGNCATNGRDEQIDWVFAPNVDYYLLNNRTFIGRTNNLALLQPVLEVSVSSDTVWTGLAADWTGSQNCSGWTGAGSGAYGYPAWPNKYIYYGTVNCVQPLAFFCVEQP